MPEFPWIICRSTLKSATGLIVGISMLTSPPLSFKFMEILNKKIAETGGIYMQLAFCFTLVAPNSYEM